MTKVGYFQFYLRLEQIMSFLELILIKQVLRSVECRNGFTGVNVFLVCTKQVQFC